MNVLSLFDGISVGQLALKQAGFKVKNYYASEIDTYAKKVTQNNFPKTQQMGNVLNWRDWDIDFSSIDLLLAGFPCQAWSRLGAGGGTTDERGKLVYTMMEILDFIRSVNPNVLFLFENVKMKSEFMVEVTDLIGEEPVFINSSLVSAQIRERYYWSNIKIKQPKDREMYIDNIVAFTNYKRTTVKKRCDRKTGCLTASYYKGLDAAGRPGVFTGLIPNETTGKDMRKRGMRMLTPEEAEYLQTMPEGYTEGISNTQRYKSIGNSWTVAVIEHIFKGITKKQKSLITANDRRH